MSHVLVTGATGFIGRHVVDRLLERGHTVTVGGRDEDRARSFVWFDRVEFAEFDVYRAPDALARRLSRVDALMHLAWPGLPDYRGDFHLDQVLPASARFLTAMVEAGVRQALVTGTCLEYGMQTGALAEDLPASPITAYAIAKDRLRRELQAFQLRNPFQLQWARLFYTHGPGQRATSLFEQLDRAIADGAPVFAMSGGEQLRDYLPVQAVAARLVALLEQPQFDGVLNICSGKPIRVRELVEARLARQRSTMRLNLGYHDYPDYEPMAFWGDPTRQQAILGTGAFDYDNVQ